ncbi:hypothetical protein ANCDUO_26850, partial [Ancylostoma duodenale]
MDALPALLQAVQQQLDLQARRMDEQGAVLAKLMEKMSAAPSALNAATPIVVRDKHAIFDSLHRRIEKFVYDPDRGRTFDIWLKRYQDLFDNECDDLDEKDKTRLLVSRLDEDCHQMLTGAIAPKQPSDVPWKEVVEVLERQNFTNYEMLVKTKCTDAKLDTIDFDGLQCSFYVAGFQGPDFAEYRTRLLRKLDHSEKITLKDLTAECQLIKSYKEDSRMLEGDISVNAVQHKKNFNRNKKKFKQQHQKKYEPN